MKTLSQVQSAARRAGFIGADKPIQMLHEAISAMNFDALRTNVVLYGPAGWGKSELARFVASEMLGGEDRISVIQFGPDSAITTLYGGINLSEWTQSGSMAMNFDNSPFVGKEVVICEEMFDAPSSVVNGLRDMLASRKMRHQQQAVDVDARVVIVATNVDPESFGSDASTIAVLERFPFQMEVGPSTVPLTSDDYIEIIYNGMARQMGLPKDDQVASRNMVKGETNGKRELSVIGAVLQQNGKSPRIAEALGRKIVARAISRFGHDPANWQSLARRIDGSIILSVMQDEGITGVQQAQNMIAEQERKERIEAEKAQMMLLVDGVRDAIDKVAIVDRPSQIAVSVASLRSIKRLLKTIADQDAEVFEHVRDRFDALMAEHQAKELAHNEKIQQMFGV